MMPLRRGDAFRLALKDLRRRSSVPLLLVLLVPSASVAVPLVMGDSFQQSLRQDIYDALGPVDEVVRSQGVMRLSIYEALAKDLRLLYPTDALGPALILPGILTGPSGNRSDTQVDIIGIDSRCKLFGAITDTSGKGLLLNIQPGKVYLREDSARRIFAAVGDTVLVRFRDPAYSLESIYTPGVPVHEGELVVDAVIGKSGLGGLNLVPRGEPRRIAFVDLGWLMEKAGREGINAILVSNKGDARSGMERTDEVVATLHSVLNEYVGYAEGGFLLSATPLYVKLENERIFFDEKMAARLAASATNNSTASISEQLSYFVNMIMANGSHIAYSTVTAFDPATDAEFGMFVDNETGMDITGELADDEIMVTSYTAERLGLSVGDNVMLNYTVYDRAFRQELRYNSFKVRYIVEMTGKANDSELMPPFPGIKGTVSCGDWRPPIPIDYSIMVPSDLDYWRAYAGTPKAYINLSKGWAMWGNDLGDLTTVKVLPTGGVTPQELLGAVSSRLNASLAPEEMGVSVEAVKRDAISSVSGLAIVTEALVAFGSAVTASGMVLIYVVVMADIEARRREIGILRSVGFTRATVAKVFALEGAVLSLGGSLLGVLAGVLLAGAGVWASNELWPQILGFGSQLYIPEPVWLAAGFLSGFVLSTLAFAIGARASARGGVSSNLRGLPDEGAEALHQVAAPAGKAPAVPYPPPAASANASDYAALSQDNGKAGSEAVMVATAEKRRKTVRWLTAACLASLFILLGMAFMLPAFAGDLLLLYYFITGDLMLLLAGGAIYLHLEPIASALSRRSRLGRVALANSARNRRRAGAYIIVYALVIFPLLTLSAYLPMETGSISALAARRGGGYDILGESEVPLYFDLADASERAAHNISSFPNASVVQFQSYGSPGGTCSNLNSDAPPRLLAANGSLLYGLSLPFAESLNGKQGRQAWEQLDAGGGRADAPSGSTVPVVGDYTTVVWIFGKGLGDSLETMDEAGRTVRLRIVGILSDSIFQGSVFMSESAMRRLYPTQSVYNLFLFKLPRDGGTGAGDVERAAAELESALAPYGLRARPVLDIAADFIRVDLAYVSMLQAMLASGVLIGTLGFAAKVARETVERRYELGVMRALGFGRGRVAGLFLGENLFLFLLGFGLALVAAMACSFSFLGTLPGAPDTALLLGLLVAAVALSTLYPVRRFNSSSVASVLRI